MLRSEPDTQLYEFLTASGIGHLATHLSNTLHDRGGLCGLYAALATVHGRLPFFSWLKALGITNLNDRRLLTNALMATARAAKAPTPPVETLRRRLARETHVQITARRCRIFAIADLRAEYPYNYECLARAMRECQVGTGDICICVGRVGATLPQLFEALRMLAATCDEVVLVLNEHEMRPGPSPECAAAWEPRRPPAALPHVFGPRNHQQRLLTVLNLCDELRIRYGSLHVHMAGESIETVASNEHLVSIVPFETPDLAAESEASSGGALDLQGDAAGRGMLSADGRMRCTEPSRPRFVVTCSARPVLVPSGSRAVQLAPRPTAAPSESASMDRVVRSSSCVHVSGAGESEAEGGFDCMESGVRFVAPSVGRPSEWQWREPSPRLLLLAEFCADEKDGRRTVRGGPARASDCEAAGAFARVARSSDGELEKARVPPPRCRAQSAAPCGELVFGTYGDAAYESQRERICRQAVDSGWFTQIWKPLVVREMLRQLRDGDVLLYADAGCSINSSATDSWWAKVCRLSEARPIDAHQLDRHNAARIGAPVTNAMWCRVDAARAVLDDCAPTSSGECAEAAEARLAAFLSKDQIEAGRLLILGCAKSRALIHEWAELALARPGLFTDDASALPNHGRFQEHRHDQSIFSALMHKYELQGSSDWTAVPTRYGTS